MWKPILITLLALPGVSLAGTTLTHCDYYNYRLDLPAPMLAVLADPVVPNDMRKILQVQEKVCARFTKTKASGDVWVIMPGTRKVTWKSSVHEDGTEVPHRPPTLGTMTVSPKEPAPTL